MSKLEFHGKVDEKGVLKIINRKDFDTCIAASFPGKEVVITIEKKRSKRSTCANAYYWSGVIPIVKKGFYDLGYIMSASDTHEWLKYRFIEKGAEMLGEDGLVIGNLLRKTTTNMTPSEFGDYIAQIKQFASEYLNVYVPEPLEQVTMVAELDNDTNAIMINGETRH